MNIIFHEPTKRNFRYNPQIRQCRQVRAEECDWTTRYLLCQDVIFHQMTEPNYDRQGRNEQMLHKQVNNLLFQTPDHDQIIGQRKDSYDIELVQNKNLKNPNITSMKIVTPINEKIIDIYMRHQN